METISEYAILFLRYIVMPVCIIAVLVFKAGMIIVFITDPKNEFQNIRRSFAASVPFTTLAIKFPIH
jgi:hypothetical protein